MKDLFIIRVLRKDKREDSYFLFEGADIDQVSAHAAQLTDDPDGFAVYPFSFDTFNQLGLTLQSRGFGK